MPPKPTTRRRYLLTAGAGLAAALAGCGSNSESPDESTPTSTPTGTNAPTDSTDQTPTSTEQPTEELPEDTNPDDGLPPEFDEQPQAIDYDASTFPRRHERVNGEDYRVPVVPVDVAYNLYARREARIVDARAQAGYEVSHVFGAVRSLTADSDSDPTDEWDQSDAVITYCHCPYHYATRRAAQLLDSGFEEVFALANGYQAWKVAGHPTGGEGVPSSAKTWTVEGESDADEGDIAYIYHNATDQVAGAAIDSDGSYTLEFAFADVGGSDDVTVGTPDYENVGTLSAFSSTTVTAETSGTATPTSTPSNGTPNNGTSDGGFGNETDSSDDQSNNDTSTDDGMFGRIVGGRFR